MADTDNSPPSDPNPVPDNSPSLSPPTTDSADASPPEPTTTTHAEVSSSTPLPPITIANPLSSSSNKDKKKRGRPRKYGPDGRPRQPPPLRATPISAAVAADTEPYTPAAAVGAAMRRARPVVGFVSKPSSQTQFGFGSAPVSSSQGEMVSCAAGPNFTPHIISVAPGEDVTMKIMSFAQQGPRAICVLSANGVISNVTLRQPDSLGGTLTYEGRFELLSLSGSFMPSENSGTRSRSGGMSVSLASPDGRVVGGGVAGLLVAASPVQVVVGTWMPGYQIDQNPPKPKKPRVVLMETSPVPSSPTIPFTITSGEADESYSKAKAPKVVSVTAAQPFRIDNL
ncbi:hypothetical protein LUZ60_009463 [Juncus effusus]|nr:hypothetical protein LUZ60_009463 [Juncus effusus]